MPSPRRPRPLVLLGLTSLALLSLSDLACGLGLPSEVPLGGSESEPRDERGRRAPRDAAEGAPQGAGKPDEVVVVSGAAGAPAADAASDAPERAAASDAVAEQAAEKTAACDDSGGTAPECKELEAGPCAPVYGPACQRLRDAVKPKIAEPVAECLARKNRTSACAEFEECLSLGLPASCPTPADERLCRETLGRCGETAGPFGDEQGCARAVAAFKPEAHEKLVECLKGSCTLHACFMGQAPGGEPRALSPRAEPAR